MASSWQYPFVNIFKEFGIGEWRRCSKEGDVTCVMERKIKSSVYRISGAIPASNYIQFPQTSSQSLGLTGRYLYIIWRPTPGKYFVIHVEIVTNRGLVVRLSISNLFKQFKTTSTWLQIPFLFDINNGRGSLSDHGRSISTPTPDNSRWTNLVLNLSSILSRYLDCEYSYIKTIKLCASMIVKGIYTSNIEYNYNNSQIPHDMTLPLTKGLEFSDIYDYISLPTLHQSTPTLPNASHKQMNSFVNVTQGIPHHTKENTINNGDTRNDVSDYKKVSSRKIIVQSKQQNLTSGPPVMDLRRVIGMSGGASFGQVIFSRLGSRVFYTCHSIIIAMETSTKEQQFFVGHTDKVVCITLSEEKLLLASAQEMGVIRLWDISSSDCVSVTKNPFQQLHILSFSLSGDLLCGVGIDSHGKTQVVLWDTSQVGVVKQIMKLSTDVNINTMRFIHCDDTRLISCGWYNIRFWRIKQNHLKSSPVNLEEYHSVKFTDLQLHQDHVYASTNTGHIFEVHYKSFSVKRVWLLFPDKSGGVVINTLALHNEFCITGSEDGILRMWPLNFTHVTLEADLESSVTSVNISSTGIQILAATNGSIGILDASNQTYNTILRSHTSTVTSMGLSPDENHLVTCSTDNTIRIWDMCLYRQIYEFKSIGDEPCIVLYHPIRQEIVCGYTSGSIRCITLDNGGLAVEHKLHKGRIVSVAITTNGDRMYSSSSSGLLVMYDSTHSIYPTLKTLGNSVAKGDRSGLTVSENGNMLACIGPLEFTVTIYNGYTLEELTYIDITPRGHNINQERAIQVLYTPDIIGQLLVLTDNGRIMKYLSSTGQFISQVTDCSGVYCIASNGKHLFIGYNNGEIKVIDYHTRYESQSFIGHCSPVNSLILSPDNSHIVSCGEAILIWDISSNHLPRSVSPRKHAPSPISYEPININVFTPVISRNRKEIGEQEMCSTLEDTSREDVELVQQLPNSTDQHSPKANKHYHYHPPYTTKPNQLFIAPSDKAALQLHRVIGYTGNGRGNVVWYHSTGLLCYSSGCVIVIEYLNDKTQQHLTGHHTEISTIVLSNDGCGLASASHTHKQWKCEIRIWRLDNNKCIKVLSYHQYGVTCMSYSQDDRFLLSVGTYQENGIAIWGCLNYDLLTVVNPKSPVHEIKWDPLTAYEFVTVGISQVQFWLLEEKTELEIKVYEPHLPKQLLHHDEEFTALCYSSNNRVFIGSTSGMVSVWNTQDNMCILFWDTGCNEIGALTCNNIRVVVGGTNGVLQLWSMDFTCDTPTVVLESSIDLIGGIYSISFDPQLQLGVVGTNRNDIWHIDWNKQCHLNMIHGHHGNITSLCYSTSKDYIASCDDNGYVIVWNTQTWNQEIIYKTKTGCTSVVFTSVQEQKHPLCVCGYSDGVVRVYNVKEGKVKLKLHPHHVPITAIQISNEVIISGSSEGVVMVTGLYNGLSIMSIKDHCGSHITDLYITKEIVSLPDIGNVHIMIISSGDRRISVWSYEASSRGGQMLDWISFPGPSVHIKNKEWIPPPTLARFLPPDRIIYTGYEINNSLHIYSLTQKQVIKRYDLIHPVSSMCLSPDTHMIAFGSPNQILTLMDSDEGSFQEYHTHCNTLSSLTFSPSGNELISTSENNFHVWKLNDF